MYKELNPELISRNLRVERSKLNISIEELSWRSGVNVTTITLLSSGKNKDCKLSTLNKLAHALDVSIEELLY